MGSARSFMNVTYGDGKILQMGHGWRVDKMAQQLCFSEDV